MHFLCPMNGTGYGVAGQGYARGLLVEDPETSLECVADFDPEGQQQDLILGISKKPSTPQAVFWFLQDMPKYADRGGKACLSTFETSAFSQDQLHGAKQRDLLLSASKWGANQLKLYFPDKQVGYVPHALKLRDSETVPQLKDSNLHEIWSKVLGIEVPDETLILSMAGKYELRKSYPEMLRALGEVQDPTLLIAFCHNGFVKPNGYDLSELHYLCYQPVPTGNHLMVFKKGQGTVVFMPRTNTREELHGALSKAHCYMSPSKGEGWDLPLFEMMSFGMHCAATLNTGHLEYCTEDNITVLEQGALEMANDGRWFLGDRGMWYGMDPDSLVAGIQRIRGLHFNGGDVSSIRQAARESTDRFSWQSSARKLIELVHGSQEEG